MYTGFVEGTCRQLPAQPKKLSQRAAWQGACPHCPRLAAPFCTRSFRGSVVLLHDFAATELDNSPATTLLSCRRGVSLDNMARQAAAGYGDPGKNVGAGNGGAHGLDLHPGMQNLLFAHQILSGEPVPGDLLRVPPATLLPLPAVPSYHAAPIQYPPPNLRRRLC